MCELIATKVVISVLRDILMIDSLIFSTMNSVIEIVGFFRHAVNLCLLRFQKI